MIQLDWVLARNRRPVGDKPLTMKPFIARWGRSRAAGRRFCPGDHRGPAGGRDARAAGLSQRDRAVRTGQSRDRRLVTSSLGAGLRDARDFIAGGAPEILARFDREQAAVDAHLGTLHAIVAGDPLREGEVAKLNPVIAYRLNVVGHAVDLRPRRRPGRRRRGLRRHSGNAAHHHYHEHRGPRPSGPSAPPTSAAPSPWKWAASSSWRR